MNRDYNSDNLSDNLRPPSLGPQWPVYPPLSQVCRIYSAVSGTLFRGYTQQWSPPLAIRDREACYVWSPDGSITELTYYICRLVGQYPPGDPNSLPLYIAQGNGSITTTGSSGSSGVPGPTTIFDGPVYFEESIFLQGGDLITISVNTATINVSLHCALNLNVTGSFTLSGLIQGGPPTEGQTVIITNVGIGILTLIHQDLSVLAAYRFYCPGVINFTLGPGRQVIVRRARPPLGVEENWYILGDEQNKSCCWPPTDTFQGRDATKGAGPYTFDNDGAKYTCPDGDMLFVFAGWVASSGTPTPTTHTWDGADMSMLNAAFNGSMTSAIFSIVGDGSDGELFFDFGDDNSIILAMAVTTESINCIPMNWFESAVAYNGSGAGISSTGVSTGTPSAVTVTNRIWEPAVVATNAPNTDTIVWTNGFIDIGEISGTTGGDETSNITVFGAHQAISDGKPPGILAVLSTARIWSAMCAKFR